MGFSRDEVAELVGAFAERPEVSALELNVSCPNVETGLIMGADADETARLLEPRQTADRQAADRQADPQRHRCAGGRPRRGARRRRRRVADQHRQGNGVRPQNRGALARRRHRGRVRPGGASDRAGAGSRRRPGDRDPDRRDGRGAERSRCARSDAGRRKSGRRRAPRASATRRPDSGSPPSCRNSSQIPSSSRPLARVRAATSGNREPPGVRSVNILGTCSKTPCKLRVLPKPSSTML